MPLQQHPVPQEISSYEFRLVGDMTLKQFLQLAGGVGIAFLIFVTPIPAFVRWPLIIFAALSGAALAFLPIEERPLSFWIFSFIKAVYSPTYYVYKAGGAENVYQTGGILASPAIISPQGDEKAQEYLSSVPTPAEVVPFEENEKGFFSRVSHLFSGLSHTPTAAPVTTPIAPVSSAPVGTIETFTESATPPAPVTAPVTVPQQESVKVEHSLKPGTVDQTTEVQQSTPGSVFSPASINGPATGMAATFNLEASPPNPPEYPNVVVGQVVDATGKIVDGAILEIRETGGPPVRAIRTNKVGHFMTVTPLRDGEYEIETEKDGLQFDVIKIKAEGKVILPVLITAKQ